MQATGASGLRQATITMIEQALAACSGNVTQAARRLGIHRSTIYRYLERHPRATLRPGFAR